VFRNPLSLKHQIEFPCLNIERLPLVEPHTPKFALVPILHESRVKMCLYGLIIGLYSMPLHVRLAYVVLI
jgi:hypothetical protein